MQFLSMIQWSDIELVLKQMPTELTILGVSLVLAIVATFAVIKLQKPMKKLVRGSAWVAFGLVVILVLNMIVSGPMYSLVNMVLRDTPTNTAPEGTGEEGEEQPTAGISSESIAIAGTITENLTGEGAVLLMNNGVLPLKSTDKINTFGWSSTNPIYGGMGSGAVSANYPIVSFLDGLTKAGIQYNTALTDWYKTWRAERPSLTMWSQDWTCPEPTQAEYEAAGIYENALKFSDIAVFFVARSGGEGADMPTTYDQPLTPGSSGSSGESEYAEDLDPSKHYLELTTRERATLTALNEKFNKIIVIVNAANAFEMGFVEEFDKISAVVLLPGGPGQNGFNAVGELLNGTRNFSGKLADTYIYDMTKAPTWNNFGHFEYTNMGEFVDGEKNSTTPNFVNYVEGIYVGYRFWETAADVGFLKYEDYVQYPFGYGLSYTTFKQELVSVTEAGGTITAKVKVTNTGSVPGKDVVQFYYNPPYTNGGIEKSTANLVAFAKTSELAAGASEELTVTWKVEDMASYDAYNRKAWVVEAGEYIISLNSDSHNIIAEKKLTLSEVVGRDSDVVAATNAFADCENAEEITYLSRKDNFANYAAATAAPTNFEMSAANKATFLCNANYDPTKYNNHEDEMPTLGAKNNLTMNDMRGLSYDDPLWEFFLDQLTIEDMVNLIAIGGYQSTEIRNIGKSVQVDLDGPASVNNTSTGVSSTALTSGVFLACTWNTDLALQFGQIIGKMAAEIDCSGWYAPAMNTHRTAFSGRNFEYYSEDGLLAGKMAAQQVKGAEEHGVYSFIKHFALNDQETNRTNLMSTWFTEQSAREIYLKPFELAVKEGGADAVMSAFNYIGTRYAGADPGLLKTVLRDEWGFKGMVLTDYFGGYGYQDADIQIRNGGDFCLAPNGGNTAVLDDQSSATSILAARQACKNICYTTCNSRAYATDVVVTTPTWQIIIWAVSAVLALALVGVELIVIKNYKKRVAQV